MPLGSNKLLTDMSTRNIFWRKWRVVFRDSKVTTITSGLFADMRGLTYWDLKGISRFVQELL